MPRLLHETKVFVSNCLIMQNIAVLLMTNSVQSQPNALNIIPTTRITAATPATPAIPATQSIVAINPVQIHHQSQSNTLNTRFTIQNEIGYYEMPCLPQEMKIKPSRCRRNAWNDYEKAGKHFLEHQLRPLMCQHGRDISLGQAERWCV